MTGDDVAVAGRERQIDRLTRDNYSYRESNGSTDTDPAPPVIHRNGLLLHVFPDTTGLF